MTFCIFRGFEHF